MFISNVQVILLESERMSDIHFPAIWRLNFNFFPVVVDPGDTSWGQ